MTGSGDAMSLVPGPVGRAAVAAGNLIVTVGRGETITSWNRAAEQLFGFNHQDAVGQTLALIMPAEPLPLSIGHPAHGGAVAQVVKFVVPRQDG
jgi:PAS domain-containing protein